MPLILLFVLLLVLCFGVLLYLLKPTAMERAVAEQLGDIEAAQPTGGTGANNILKREVVNANPFLQQLTALTPWAPAASRLIRQAGQEWQVGPFLLFSLIAAAGIGWIAWLVTSSFLVSLGMAIAVMLSPYGYLMILREVRYRRFETLLPEAVDLMSRGLRAGHSITSVLEMVGKEIADPVGVEFRSLHEEQSLGLPLRETVLNLVDRMPIDDMRFLATALLLQKESGGNLAQILDKTSLVVRERARLRGQLRIYTAQGRITGWILCLAPFAMFGILSITSPTYAKTLLTDPLGIKLIYLGLGLMALGILSIRKIIDVKV